MPIKKVNGIYHIDIRCPDGSRIRRSTKTSDKKLAQQLHDKIKSDLWKEDKLDQSPSFFWQQAVTRYLKEKSHKKSIENDKLHLRWVGDYLRNVELKNIDRNLIDTITQARLECGVSHATVNRMLEIIRSILNLAFSEWEILEKVPRIRMLPEPKNRIRFLSPEEAKKLLNELPSHLRDMASFTLATGLRENNVTQLEWSQIDITRKCAWIHPDQAKTGNPISVPLNSNAIAILETRKGVHEKFVFTYEGHAVTKCNNHAWRKALARAGIENFRWHDLRHTWASWHVMAGTPLAVLKELGGWSNMETVMRYAHLSPGHISSYADNVGQEMDKKQIGQDVRH